ncbi:FecR family protein [Seonamhaeicola marinus]|uniref:FecR family protein n=1 Tax=Seonamhaeicola marinus TaxID=1912246 RepID=A0A5D0HWL9_9FLAO|nr:FecR family protein [Seonamhaeicola marinus]TYA74527.1 FecR family protein [Seonamhaeicola marinus]
MTNPKVEKIIAKYLTNQASADELDELQLWLEEEDNEETFIEYIKVNYAVDYNLKSYNIDASKKELLNLISKEKKVHKMQQITGFVKYAAAIVVLLGLGYFLQQGYFDAKPELVIPKDKITLQLENGNIEVLSEDGSRSVVDKNGNVVGTQSGTELSYVNSSTTKKLVYNTLTIPYGKHFKITLSDGTKVHLNSGSSLKYPVDFIDGKKRKVFLSGEAYFDVHEDKTHPFIVNSDALNVEVLGTEFNVTAYPEDIVTDVVLVEGSVGLYEEESSINNATVIKPGVKGSLSKANNEITTEEVNVAVYTSWRNGGLFFRNIPFENIAKRMERHYNMKIIVENDILKKEMFSANFNDEPITKILSYFKDSYNINYTIKDNTIYIK